MFPWGSLMARVAEAGLLACLMTVAPQVLAQEVTDEPVEYAAKVEAAQRRSPLGEGAFGEQISTFTGGVTFRVVDVSVPGNGNLQVEVSRTRTIQERFLSEGSKPDLLGGFYDWDIEIPHLEGVFSQRGWVVGTDDDPARYTRCSLQRRPYIGISSEPFPESRFWSGYNLYVPGQGASRMLVAASGIPMPSDGKAYPWATKQHARIGCLSQTRNGVPGEAFVAIMPNGNRYFLDYVVTREMTSYRYKPNPLGSSSTVPRSHVYFLASRVEDRFGNWVNYNYTGDKLTSISASDGRSISLTYNGDRITSVSTSGRSWTYQYREPAGLGQGGLSAVTMPDGSRWSYAIEGTVRPPIFPVAQEGTECDPPIGSVTGPYVYTIGSPYGATGRFTFNYRYFSRAQDISSCTSPASPPVYGVWSLASRVISGPGMPSSTTQYDARNGFAEGSRWTIVTQPDGAVMSYRHGVVPQQNEGQLLEVRTASANNTVVESQTHDYLTEAAAAGQFVARLGNPLSIMDPDAGVLNPERLTVTTRDGTSYTFRADKFDLFARPVETYSGSNLGSVRDRTAYYDHLGVWLIGRLSSITDMDSGVEQRRTEFDANGMPSRNFAFGQLERVMTYNGLGDLASETDALGNTTRFEDYYRGVPRLVTFADGTTRTATVDDNAWVTSVTNENADTTTYGYDPMGRLVLVRQPANDSVAWYDTTITFGRVDVMEHGIGPGHWKEQVYTGNARTITYYDGLWRPVFQERFDAQNPAETLSQSVRTFDHAGRMIFESYPGKYR